MSDFGYTHIECKCSDLWRASKFAVQGHSPHCNKQRTTPTAEPCGRCGHARLEHKGDDDIVCQLGIGYCQCSGWEPVGGWPDDTHAAEPERVTLPDTPVVPPEPPDDGLLARDAVAQIIHFAEGFDWPGVSADPKGGCLGMDRCRFVADRLLDPAHRAAVLRALGLREERQQSMGGLHIPVPRRRFVTEWEDVTDDE